MRKYLVTIKKQPTKDGMQDREAGREELPPGAKLLTREKVDKAISERYLTTRHQKKELLDELFGEEK